MTSGGTRVRFAPSPTGHLHVGGARTALFNWLFARHTGGRFIIRIEDTDVERSTGRFEEEMLEDLRWLGLDWDEGPGIGGGYGPYRQSERIQIYSDHAVRLVESGRAFPCFCTDEQLEERREEMKKAGRPPQYDGACRHLTAAQREEARGRGLPESIRFSVEGESGRTIDDLARGEVSFPPGMVGDFVILRSNGLPTYNFAAAVDDSLMGITHVIRGGEHLANTLRQVMIYEALSMEMPVFAHIPLILGSDGSKLSKRHGAPNIRDYRDKGYPPEALVNYLAFLGWATRGENEILSSARLIEEFELERVSDSPSTFDDAKLNWVSAHHVRAGGVQAYFEAAVDFFPARMREAYDDEALREIFGIIAENLPAFSLIPEEAAPFMPGIPDYGEEEMSALAGSAHVLEAFADAFASVEVWDPDSIRAAIKTVGKECGVKGKDLYMPLRLAVTGASHGPDLTSILRIRGREETVSVLRAAASGGHPGEG